MYWSQGSADTEVGTKSWNKDLMLALVWLQPGLNFHLCPQEDMLLPGLSRTLKRSTKADFLPHSSIVF